MGPHEYGQENFDSSKYSKPIILTLQQLSQILILVFLAYIHESKSPKTWFEHQFIFTLCKDSILYLLWLPTQLVGAAKKDQREVKIFPAQPRMWGQKWQNMSRHKSYMWGQMRPQNALCPDIR